MEVIRKVFTSTTLLSGIDECAHALLSLPLFPLYFPNLVSSVQPESPCQWRRTCHRGFCHIHIFFLFSRRAGRGWTSGILYVQIVSCYLRACFCTPAPCLPAPYIAQPWLHTSFLWSWARAAYQFPAELGCAQGGRRREGPRCQPASTEISWSCPPVWIFIIHVKPEGDFFTVRAF